MKFRTLIIACFLAMLGISVAVPTASAFAPDQNLTTSTGNGPMIAQMMAQALNTDELRRDFIGAAEGAFDSYSATAKGSNLFLNFGFSEDLNLNLVSEEEKNSLLDFWADVFREEMGDAFDEMKQEGLIITMYFFDHYGNDMSRKI